MSPGRAHTALRAPHGPAEDTGARIRAAALELFARQGYEKTSLRQIADRLGVTKAALYYHYRSKQDLLEALVDPVLADIETLLHNAPAGASAGPVVRQRFLGEYLATLLHHRAVIGYFAGDGAALSSSGLGPRLVRLRDHLGSALGGTDATLADRLRTAAAIGALQAGLVAAGPDVPDEQVREPLLAAAYGALGLTEIPSPAVTVPAAAPLSAGGDLRRR